MDKEPKLGLKLAVALGAIALNGLVYYVANHFPLSTPQLLPWTRLDAAVPFLPRTIWIYDSDYLLVAGAFLLCRSTQDMWRFLRAFAVLLIICCAIHVLWPTTYPRDHFVVRSDGATSYAYWVLHKFDRPTSCLPSMHVAGAGLAALSLWRNPRWQRVVWGVWAGLIALSTMSAKQHYAVDVVAGAAVAGLVWVVFFQPAAQRLAHRSAEQHGARA
jgi:membrane-associated phospholipid phosphatase